jgi:hypothetical protein
MAADAGNQYYEKCPSEYGPERMPRPRTLMTGVMTFCRDSCRDLEANINRAATKGYR